MSNNNNKEMKDNKPLLWESWMSLEDYKIRQSFYNGTAQPRSYPITLPPEGSEVMDKFNYPMQDEYCDEYGEGLMDALWYFQAHSYKFCSDELLDYSLRGIKSIDVYDV